MGRSDVEEQDLPGIGRRYDLEDAQGQPVCVIVHHIGRRDVYTKVGAEGEEEDELELILTFDDEARRLGAILGAPTSSRRW